MTAARVAILQFPGVNCEAETARALARAGLTSEIVRWTRPPADLDGFDAFVLPGGFSHQDRVRAGALAAKDPMMDALADGVRRGRPVLGICNGAQVLVEAGLVPGSGRVELALARNRMPGRTGYFTRWIHVRIEASPCVFTRHLEPGTLLPMPVAHGEGRFTGRRGRVRALVRAGLAPLRYACPDGSLAADFPDNPNGSDEAVAAVCNPAGTVLAMMPHPERVQEALALPRRLTAARAAAWPPATAGADAHVSVATRDTPAPALALFVGLRRHLEEA